MRALRHTHTNEPPTRIKHTLRCCITSIAIQCGSISSVKLTTRLVLLSFACEFLSWPIIIYLFHSICVALSRGELFFSHSLNDISTESVTNFSVKRFYRTEPRKNCVFFWIRLIKLESCIGAGGSQNRVPLTCDCVAVGQKCTWRLWNVVKRHNTFYWFLVERIAFHRNFTCILCAIDKLMQLWDYRL